MALRAGLTGGLGSGKSTVARMLAEHGAQILSADEIARGLMEPGQAVFEAIVTHFGPGVLLPAGVSTGPARLNRPALARLAFQEGRLEELNKIIHPATIARGEELTREMVERDPGAIVVTESALLFETTHGHGWRERFDCVVLVTASDETKVSRFIQRSGWTESHGARERVELEAEAKRRLLKLIPDNQKAPQVHFIVDNDGDLPALRHQVDALWSNLLAAASRSQGSVRK